jgi:glucose/arabinose dehydrogenase
LPQHLGQEQGLWNVTVHPTRPYVYASAVAQTDPTHELRGTWRVVRFELLSDGSAGPLEEVCTGLPAADWHNGGALAFSQMGELYLSVGDLLDPLRLEHLRTRLRNNPASPLGGLSQLAGAIIRVDPDRCDEDGESKPLSDIVVSIGFRNPYSLALAGDGSLFATENGPSCCDQIVRVEPGSDKGWPQYGITPEDLKAMQADEFVLAPLVSSAEKTIAPTEIIFYDGKLYGELAGSLIYGTFHAGSLFRASLDEGLRRVLLEEVLLTMPVEQRSEYFEPGGIIGVAEAPDGSIYFATLDTIYRLTAVPPLEPEPKGVR